MNSRSRNPLLNVLQEFCRRYPDWRFGQVVANLAGWAENADPWQVSDECLLETARAHLARRFGDGQEECNGPVASTRIRQALFIALGVLGERYPEWRLGQLVARLAALAHVNIYDAEDQQLLEAATATQPGLGWFEWHEKVFRHASTVREKSEGQSYRCPCCHFLTLQARGGFEICPVCYWEDDGQDEEDADLIRGGPNGTLNLTRAREHYARYGVCDLQYAGHTRPPRREEVSAPSPST